MQFTSVGKRNEIDQTGGQVFMLSDGWYRLNMNQVKYRNVLNEGGICELFLMSS